MRRSYQVSRTYSACLLLVMLVVSNSGLVNGAAVADIYRFDDNTLPPPLILKGFRDQTHNLEDYRGSVVLVNFWASWCPPCVYEMPAMKRLKQDLNDQPFEILAPNVGEKKYRVLRFTRLVKFDLLVLLDTDKEAFSTWGGKILPTSYLIDASGRLRYRIRGNPDWDDENTRALITELVEEVSQTFASTD